MRITIVHLCKKMKAGSGIGKGLLKAFRVIRACKTHLTEDSEIFLEVGSDGAEKYDGQPVTFENCDCTRVSTTRRVGVP